MKTMMLAAAALTLSMGAALANEGGPVANSQFTEIPGVIAQAPVQTPSVATAQNGQSVQVYGTHSPITAPGCSLPAMVAAPTTNRRLPMFV